MITPDISTIKTKEQARQTAIDWQNWIPKHSQSYAEMINFYVYFQHLATKFNLFREFKENGIL